MGQPTDNFGEDAVPDWSTQEFDELYASVGADLDQVPWARLRPNPTLLEWLDAQDAGPGRRALVVACGLGDDAEELARRGYEVTAFDLSETAIGWCRKRFPESTVDYRVADLLALPAAWARGYDLVFELYTIQSLPLAARREVVAALAAPVAAGGTLLVRCSGRGDDEPVGSRPWSVSRADLASFAGEGLAEVSFTDDVTESGRRFFAGVYRR